MQEHWAEALLESMDSAARAIAREDEGPGRTSRLARMMAATADLLGAMARGCGGLRSGPAHNQAFAPALALIEAGRLEEGLAGLVRAREGWLGEPRLLVRLARHYEGAVQALVRQTVLSARDQVGFTQPKILILLALSGESESLVLDFGFWILTRSGNSISVALSRLICYELKYDFNQ